MENPGTLQWVMLAFNALMSIVGVLVGFLLKTVLDRVAMLEKVDEKLADQVKELAISMPTHYVTKMDHKNQLDNIFDALRRIEFKLDGKQDKL